MIEKYRLKSKMNTNKLYCYVINFKLLGIMLNFLLSCVRNITQESQPNF